jgi:3-oxoacyl-(acyl-carrier-protein) synthase
MLPKEGNMLRRVVITGLGVLACNGIGKEDFWNACVAGRSGLRRITRFDASPLPSQIAGEIADFNPEALGLTAIDCLFGMTDALDIHGNSDGVKRRRGVAVGEHDQSRGTCSS